MIGRVYYVNYYCDLADINMVKDLNLDIDHHSLYIKTVDIHTSLNRGNEYLFACLRLRNIIFSNVSYRVLKLTFSSNFWAELDDSWPINLKLVSVYAFKIFQR